MILNQTNAQSIMLLPKDFDPMAGTMVNISGWGFLYVDDDSQMYSERLQIAELPVLERTECQKIYGNNVTEKQFCTLKNGTDACFGDGGGPAAHNGILYGIISWGEGCADKPGVYTNVGSFIDWIHNNSVIDI